MLRLPPETLDERLDRVEQLAEPALLAAHGEHLRSERLGGGLVLTVLAERQDLVRERLVVRETPVGRRIMSRKAGDFVLYPWDSGKFEDNKGFYRLRLHLRRGNGMLPDIT
jgi:hypothetical protein